jgi:hypothetical protein
MFPGGKGGRCVGLTNLPPSCGDCLEIWEPQPAGTLQAFNDIALPLSYKNSPGAGTQKETNTKRLHNKLEGKKKQNKYETTGFRC